MLGQRRDDIYLNTGTAAASVVYNRNIPSSSLSDDRIVDESKIFYNLQYIIISPANIECV